LIGAGVAAGKEGRGEGELDAAAIRPDAVERDVAGRRAAHGLLEQAAGESDAGAQLSTPFHKYTNVFRRYRSLAVAALKPHTEPRLWSRILSRDRKGVVWQEYVTELLK